MPWVEILSIKHSRFLYWYHGMILVGRQRVVNKESLIHIFRSSVIKDHRIHVCCYCIVVLWLQKYGVDH